MTGDERPLVTVLVTAYRHERFVVEGLDSLRVQDYPEVEVIITDDCSPDGTADRIQQWLDRTGYPATFIRNQRNVGICAVRNRALQRATGTFVCSLAGDDAYLPDRVHRQATFFASLPGDVALVYSDVLCCGEDGASMAPSFLERSLGPGSERPEAAFHRRLLEGNFVPAAGVMVRRSAIEAVGGYDEGLAFEDFDMWLRLSSRYTVRHLAGPVARYRIHPDSMTNSTTWVPRLRRDTIRILTQWATSPDARAADLPRRLRRDGLTVALDGCLPTALEALAAARRSEPRLGWTALEGALRLPGAFAVTRAIGRLWRAHRGRLRSA